MNFNVEFVFVWLVIASGLILAIDKWWLAPRRNSQVAVGEVAKQPYIVEFVRSIFVILLIVLAIRSFVIDHYRVPSGSLEPTINAGDFILVNKFSYGIHLPITNTKLIPVGRPVRGDLVVFRYPLNPEIYFIKRLIGLPGDKISYINKQFYINDQPLEQQWVNEAIDESAVTGERDVNEYIEFMDNKSYHIYQRRYEEASGFHELIIPEGHYFMIGDNRDNSSDSRAWGFVSEKALVGKAFGIWLSWDPIRKRIRWHRIGTGF